MSAGGRRASWCARAALVALSTSATVACGGGIEGGAGPRALAAVDPGLLAEARLFVFSFARGSSCADLVDRSPSEIGDALSGEDAPLQPVENGDEVSHAFGDVPTDAPVAFFVLASSAARDELGQRVDFADLSGTVFGIACRDYQPTSGARVDLPMTLFPVGLR
jgi:hypothetical protein